MLDLHDFSVHLTTASMSRKRTRSRSEEVVNSSYVQPTIGFSSAAPFSEDPIPTKLRNLCNYSNKITLEMAKSGQTTRSIRVYADGIFDLFHQGHSRALMQAKQSFLNVYLIVGVYNDKVVNQLKGLTVMFEDERYNVVRHCRYVDEVIKNAPWECDDNFLNKHKIDFVAHDILPYTTENNDIYDLKFNQLNNGISTSDIVARIVRDYDMYVRRNLARGYSAKELNVSFLKEKTIKLQDKMDELKHIGRRYFEKTDDIISKWEDKSRDFIENFLTNFFKRPLKLVKQSFLKALTPPNTPDDSDDEIISPRKIRKLY